MIRLTCTNCRTTLEVDEGFAGGVCRCNHCATIQTVPHAGETQTRGKTIFKKAGPAASELDRLSETISGSGLAGSGLGYANPRHVKKPNMLGLIVAGSIALGLLITGLMWFSGSSRPPTLVGFTPSPGATTPILPSKQTVPATPSFSSVDLSRATRVVYLLDRGDATSEYFDDARVVVFNSAASLGPTRSFQLVFWAQGDSVEVFPAAPANSTPQNVQDARIAAMEIIASRSTDAKGGLAKAMTAGPSDIVLITGKGWQLDDEFAEALLAVRGTTPIRVHTVSLGVPSAPLATIAQRTGGTTIALDADALRALAGP